MTPRTVTLIVVLSAGAIGSWYLSRPETGDEDRGESVDPVHHGYYLKQARILGTGDAGNLLYEIAAEYAEQQEDRRIEFTDVRIRYAPQSGVPWTVNADYATLREGNPQIVLRGHVRALSKGDSEAEDTEIRTQYLELDPERFVAQTDGRVQIRIGARSLTAIGMLASLNEDKIELKSNVSGKIVP